MPFQKSNHIYPISERELDLLPCMFCFTTSSSTPAWRGKCGKDYRSRDCGKDYSWVIRNCPIKADAL